MKFTLAVFDQDSVPLLCKPVKQNQIASPYVTLRGDKVSVLTHIYPHKPLRKIRMILYSHQADRLLYVWPDV